MAGIITLTSDAANAPKAVGPYSQCATCGDLIFLSGQVGIDPATGKLAAGGFDGQAEQVMRNLKSVLQHQGLDFSRVLKSTIFVTDLSNFQTLNAIYERCLEGHKPARSTIQVAALPLGAVVEIEMIAHR